MFCNKKLSLLVLKRKVLERKIIYVITLVALYSLSGLTPASAQSLKPFTTDGCSVFPDGNLANSQLWLDCCVAHDLAYWKGGTYVERQKADRELQECVEKLGEPQVARIMLIGVRLGGSPYFPTSFRWGYGWDYLRGYQPLSKKELTQVEKLMPKVSDHLKEKGGE